MDKTYQAKHISDEAFLEAIRETRDVVGIVGTTGYRQAYFSWTFRWYVQDYLRENNYPWVNGKLVAAKARSLINRGVIDGCDCGCRGDYEIVNEKGPIQGPLYRKDLV